MEHAALPLHPAAAILLPALLWIPALPLAAFVILILIGRRLMRWSAWVAVASLAGSCALTLSIAEPVFHGHRLWVQWAWLSASDPRWAFGLSVDGLSWLMLSVVTSIGTMILLYSIGYMRDDPRVSRFFAYLSLFCASMLGLVMADHFVLLYACWELVGLCSYLLISFWFEKPSAAAAGRKAFLTTRIGDTGLLIGILLLAWTAHALQFSELDAVRARLPVPLLTAVSLLIFLGAVGKSAQIPLHVWLPDAMEGPTPVSALIHAATMVAAGVYLVARTLPLFTPQSLQVVLGIGLLTHVLAGTVALTMTDIKRVLAYSTLSQLGLMMTALGLGAMSAAMFHLVTHAWCKALLFLGAGSVIHATHQQELSHLGGLWREMPWTATCFLIASLSMSGLFLLSGFWSKDTILLAAQQNRPWLMWTLLGGAVMTSAYIFRLYLRCFHGPRPSPAGHPKRPAHESPWVMVLPMAVLAAGAAAIGLVESPWYRHPLFRLLGDPHVHAHIDPVVAGLSTVSLAAGVALAWIVGVRRRNLLPTSLRPLGHRLYTWAAGAYHVDAWYDRFIIQPVLALTERLAHVDRRVIDGAVDGIGSAGWSVSLWKERFDRLVVDRFVNGLAQAIRASGIGLRWVQTGIVQHYLLVVVVSVVVLSVVLHHH
ncbi:MAG: NADH-quinone oxidoreductase subunit L [Candidatus Omnitrophica bacterium]|nr:NADH-quinone oxidoreductase subunit L [Candidatus Omnitrophota bacterium]